jgi:alkylation response protein AidB-like acyl-CoA dehydrogenase
MRTILGVAGYSDTPLARKLGLKPGLRTFLQNAPPHHHALFAEQAHAKTLRGPLDHLHVFETDRSALALALPKLDAAMDDAGMLWISWPKKASGRATTLDESAVRELGLATGLVDVKVCAVGEVWSGLKSMRRLADRTAEKPTAKPAKKK